MQDRSTKNETVVPRPSVLDINHQASILNDAQNRISSINVALLSLVVFVSLVFLGVIRADVTPPLLSISLDPWIATIVVLPLFAMLSIINLVYTLDSRGRYITLKFTLMMNEDMMRNDLAITKQVQKLTIPYESLEEIDYAKENLYNHRTYRTLNIGFHNLFLFITEQYVTDRRYRSSVPAKNKMMILVSFIFFLTTMIPAISFLLSAWVVIDHFRSDIPHNLLLILHPLNALLSLGMFQLTTYAILAASSTLMIEPKLAVRAESRTATTDNS